MIASGVSAAFPAAADITDIVQLSVAQTVALYGDQITAQYYTTNNAWADCTFTYLGSTSGRVITEGAENLQTAGYASANIDLLFGSDWLWYGVPETAIPNLYQNNVSFQFRLTPSINIEGIAYFRQIIATVRSETFGTGYDPWRSEYRVNSYVSYSPTSIVTYGRALDMSTTDTAANVYFTPYPLNIYDNETVYTSAAKCAFCDVTLQDIDSSTGQENTFDYTGVLLRPTRCTSRIVNFTGDGASQGSYYLMAISCPRVTDGYVLPDVPTTAPDYSGQLDSIITQGAANNTLLQQILAKLDLIYQRMQQQGYNPTLTPAATIPRDLQQYYTGIATAAPSASAINAAAGGGALVPFSDILTASGLGQVFGLLVGLCCAGWVLTRGRSG